MLALSEKECAKYMVHEHSSDIAKFKQEAAASDGAVSAIAKIAHSGKRSADGNIAGKASELS